MALFKIFKGTDVNKLTNPAHEDYIPLKDGYCYFDTTTGLFFIDAEVVKEDGTTGIVRAPINASKAIYDINGDQIDHTYLAQNNLIESIFNKIDGQNINIIYNEETDSLMLSIDFEIIEGELVQPTVVTANSFLSADEGVEIGTVTIDGNKTSFYAPAGTVTGVIPGEGLLGGGASGGVTLSVGAGTGIVVNATNVAAKLRNTTALTANSVSVETIADRIYPVAVDKSGYLSVNVPWTDTTYNVAGSDLGLVQSGGNVTISNGIITVNDSSHNHTISNITNLQDVLDDKASLTGNNTFTGKNIFTVGNSYNTVETQKFVIGNAGSAFVFGGDGLQCFSGTNSTTGKIMYINQYGGPVQIGGSQTADTTIMGKLTLNGSSGNTSLSINSKDTSSYIQFGDNNKTTLGYLGFSETNTPVFYHSTDGAKILYHTGNLSLVSTSTNGLMSKEDKTTLDNVSKTYLPLAGGEMTGHIYLTGAKENSSIGNTSQLIFGTPNNNHVAISSNKNSLIINPDLNNETSNSITLSLNGISKFPNGLEGNLIGNVNGNATSADKVNHYLNFTVGGIYKGSFDGSEDKFIDVNAVDLNISSALSFLGIVNIVPTSATVTLTDGTIKTATNGSVVILESTGVEYFFDGTSWTALGSGESYAIADHTHGNITNEGYFSNSPNRLIRTDSEGKIISGLSFSSDQTTKFLNENGTWQTVNINNYYHSTGNWGGADNLTYTATSHGGAPTLDFTLPTTSKNIKGVVKIGDNISVDAGSISITKANVEAALGFTPLDSTTKYALSDTIGGDALVAKKLATTIDINGIEFDGTNSVNNYGICSTGAAVAAKEVSITNFKLVEGAQIVVKFINANTIAEPTLNVNSTGDFPIYRYGSTKINTGTTTSGWTAGAIQRFTYDGTGWVRDYWYNTTYSNQSLGNGYGTCTTAAATVAKVVTLSSYSLVAHGTVSVKFTYSVPANATMNINGKGAKAIFYRGAAIANNIIRAGDIATFIYDGTQYQLISIDKSPSYWTATIGTTWTGSAAPYTQNITVTGITANDRPHIDINFSGTYDTDEKYDAEWGKIYRIASGTNQITVYAKDKPSIAIPIQIEVNR